jgi:hypothetical protein
MMRVVMLLPATVAGGGIPLGLRMRCLRKKEAPKLVCVSARQYS